MASTAQDAQLRLIDAKKAWREAAAAIRPNRELRWSEDLRRCCEDAQRLVTAAQAMAAADLALAAALTAQTTPVQEGSTDA